MSDRRTGFRDVTYTTRDGLRLYARVYPAAAPSRARPVLCLPGLTRNSRDFHDIATALATHSNRPRTVHALDLRGRGKSEHDKDWRNYAIPIEMLDVIDYMTSAELFKAGIIGTSRGGLITMLLGAAEPSRLGAVVLNDIGPVIEADGLMRIASYVGRMPLPKTWDEAGRLVLDLNKRDFPNLTQADAVVLARQFFNEKAGRPASGYDRKLARSLSVLDGPIPALWPQFETLNHVPVLVVRGERSDLLSAKTVDEMGRRHPQLSSLTVSDEGHAPLLRDAPTIQAIARFFAGTDEPGLEPFEMLRALA